LIHGFLLIACINSTLVARSTGLRLAANK
jgi:hypothetical protein